MREINLPIVGSSTFSRYSKMSIARAYNMIISDDASVPYSGYKNAQTITPSDQGARGFYKSTPFNHIFSVYEDRLYLQSSNLGVSFIDTIDTNSGSVYFAQNNNSQVALVDGLNIYVFNTSNSSFTTITGESLGISPGYVTFQDTYIIISDASSNQWRLSNNNDALTYPAINVGLLQSKPDKCKAVIAFNRQLFVFGETVTEIWHDVGNILFPYVRDNCVAIDYGLLSVDSLDSGFDRVVWLGSNENSGPVLLVSTGGLPMQLATDGIEFLLGELKNPQSSSGFLFQEDGHVFYQISFVDPEDNITLVYDFSTNKFFNLTDQYQNAHIAKYAVFFNNKNYFVSRIDGNLYEFGTQFTTYDGLTIPRIIVTPPLRMPDSSIFVLNNVTITLDQGNTSQLQSVDLSISKDGGASFGPSSRKYLNKLGVRQNKLQWWNLGSGNDITLQFRFWSSDLIAEQEEDDYKIYTRNDQLKNKSEKFVIISGTAQVLQ